MAYAEEQHPESDIPAHGWRAIEFDKFEYSYSDEQLAKAIEYGILEGEELEAALHRMAQIAAVTGSVDARVPLAVYGGIDIHEGALFRRLVYTPVDGDFDLQSESELLRRARKQRDSGDYLKYLALAGVIGFYPPESSDAAPCLDSPLADPSYDSRHDFRISYDAAAAEAFGNGG